MFIAPPWPRIYTTDSERHQDFAEAVRTHDAMVAAYTQHGYELNTLPRSDVASRVQFIQQHTAAIDHGAPGSPPPELPRVTRRPLVLQRHLACLRW
ncbi:AAA family ATPase [Micromonospora zamorensis]|uniref:AAA family ATPase n=1 Tax=Micromonospora zamorensis TaxID=709883 RepID=UPI0033A12E87